MQRRQPGDRLGRYSLTGRLGAGGYGEVWEACLHGPGGFRKPVALKLLEGSPTGAQSEQLLREARLGALLHHPNVVATYEVGRHEGVWYVALELVRGASLAALLRDRGALSAAAVLDVGVQVAAALAHVHQLTVDGRPAGLVHRDVKPSNLLVDRTGMVKLADLGIAAAAGEAALRAGTPEYMPPEQAGGRSEPASDLFSLGATLYTLATGTLPFGRRANARAAANDVERLLASPAFLEPVEDAVPGLGRVIRHCLRFRPEDRPRSAAELLEELLILRGRASSGRTLLDRLGDLLGDIERDPAPTPGSGVARGRLPVGNVPRPPDGFVARRDELPLVQQLVEAGERMITLLGPGGVGKTTLAMQCAGRQQHVLPGGAWIVELAEAQSQADIVRAVAATVGVSLEAADPVGQIGRVLRSWPRALVVLDNLEQCTRHLPPSLGRWIDLAPEITFLATSRTVLGLRGERRVVLGGLPQAEATAMLLALAPRRLDAGEAAEAEALCDELGRLPLAIELAAPRLGILSAGAMRARLGLSLLAGEPGAGPDRQRSMTASLAWSWDLLSADARSGLAQLSVFEGGFPLEAAEAVFSPGERPAPGALQPPSGSSLLDVLQELTDASLLRVEIATARFSVLGVVSEFAAERADPASRLAAERRHGAFYAQFGAPDALEAIDGPQGATRRAALEREVDNLAAASRRAVARRDEHVAVTTAIAGWAAVELGGAVDFGRELLLAARGVVTSSLLLARLDLELAALHGRARDPLEGLVCAERALAVYRAAGDLRHEGVALGKVASLCRILGRTARAEACYADALDRLRRAGARRSEGVVLANRGVLEMATGRYVDAGKSWEAALPLLRQAGDRRREALVLGHLAWRLDDRARPAEAFEALERSLRIAREFRDRRLETNVLLNLAILGWHRGYVEESRARLEAALTSAAGLPALDASVLGTLGSVLAHLGRPAEALSALERARALAERVAEPRLEGSVRARFGSFLASYGEPRDAEAHLLDALDLARTAGDRVGVLMAECALAGLLLDTDRVEEAGRHLDAAEAERSACGDRRVLAGTACRRGRMLAIVGQADLARTSLDAALAVGVELGAPLIRAEALLELATLEEGRGDLASASALAERAHADAEQILDPGLQAVALSRRAELCAVAGDAETAGATLDMALATAPPGHRPSARAIARARARMYNSGPDGPPEHPPAPRVVRGGPRREGR